MKNKILFAWLLVITFISRHRKFLILGIILGFFTTLVFLQVYPIYSRLTGTKDKRIGIIGRFNENNLPITIRNQLSLGLTSLLSSGEATASLAKKWDIEQNGQVYIFHLQTNIYWHDGKKFTSKDINYKIKDVALSVLDDNTLKIALKDKDGYSPLPTILSLPLFRSNLVGLGIYKLSRIQYKGDFISELLLKSQTYELSNITYRFYPTLEDAILAFKLGEIDILQNVTDIYDLATWKNVKVTTTTLYDNFVGVFFNLKDSLFKEKEVRQALTYAIAPIEKFTKAFTPISPLSWAYSPKVRLYRYDPETASKMLTKTALASSSSEITITTFPSFVQLSQSIVDAWSKVGVKAKVKVVNSLPSEYQILLLAQSIPADPDQYQYWQSTQTSANLTHYNNQKIDKLLEDGRKTLDKDKRIKIYADFQRYLVDDAPVIFLYYPKVYTVERK